MTSRVIALGNPDAGDDGAAILAARRLGLDVIVAGRPGVGLLDLLSGPRPVVLVDVISSGRPVGQIVTLDLAELADQAAVDARMSSHDFGPGEALRLARALGRSLPPGRFVGVEGADFTVGNGLSPEVDAAMDSFVAAIRAAAAGG